MTKLSQPSNDPKSNNKERIMYFISVKKNCSFYLKEIFFYDSKEVHFGDP
jgi:hypothetical protein